MILFFLFVQLFIVLFINYYNIKMNKANFCNAVFVITLGMLYYQIIPCFYFFVFAKNSLTFAGVEEFVKQITDKKAVLFITITTFFYLFFCCSFLYFLKKNRNADDKFETSITINIFFYLLFFLAIKEIFILRNSFFSLYTDENYGNRGPFMSATILLFYLSLVEYKKNNKKRKLLVLIPIFGLHLAMGTRQYVMSFMLSLLCFLIDARKINLKLLFIIVIISGFSMGIIGSLREGWGVSLEKIFYIIFAEPFFTSYSLFSSILLNPFPLLRLPAPLFLSFINIVPSYLYPEKGELIHKITYGFYKFYSPLGAKHLFVGIIENFGIIGGMISSFLLAYMLVHIKRKNICSYYMILGFLCFSLFRNGFIQSIVKDIIEFSIIFPLIIRGFSRFLSISCKNKNSKIIKNICSYCG